MGNDARNAKIAQGMVRIEGKSVTSCEIYKMSRRYQFEKSRYREIEKRRELEKVLAAQFSDDEKAALAVRFKPGRAYGSNDLHRAKARALPMGAQWL